MPKDARKKADAELKKLKLMSPMSAEATVVRNYIDVLTGLPWAKRTKIKHDLAYAEQVLEVVAASPDLEVSSRVRGDRPLTRFERRGIAAGREIADVVAVRR